MVVDVVVDEVVGDDVVVARYFTPPEGVGDDAAASRRTRTGPAVGGDGAGPPPGGLMEKHWLYFLT